MTIDGHVHVGTCQCLQMDASIESLLAIADQVGFDRIFVTHVTALYYEMREGNDLLGDALGRHPDRLLGYVTIPTHRFGEAACEEIRRCRACYGMRGVKMYSYPEAPVTEAASTRIFETAASLGMPVLGHFTPDECDLLMQRVPDAMVVMAHMGGHPTAVGNWHLAVEVAGRHRNLYLDTASSQIDDGMIEHAVERLGAEKILFGTDTPLLDPWVQWAKIEGAEISEAAKKLIGGGNLARILGL